MSDRVENRNYIRYPVRVSNVKSYLKNTWVLLFRELFAGEQARGFDFTNEPASKASGLKILPKYPQTESDLPTVTVSFRSPVFKRLGVNTYLPPAVTQSIDENYRDESELGKRQGYAFQAELVLDISAVSDSQRDEILDLLFDFLAWNQNSLGLDIRQHLVDRGIHIIDDLINFNGDTEMPINETGDLMYTDGLVIPFVGEVFSPKEHAPILQGADWEAEIADEQ